MSDEKPEAARVSVTVRGPEEGEEYSMSDPVYVDAVPFGMGTGSHDTARFNVGRGMTINLGGYSTARVDVGLEMPIHVQDLDRGVAWVDAFVKDRIKTEVDAIVARTGKDPGVR